MSRTVRRFGAAALLVDLDSQDEVLALHAALQGLPAPGQRELVPASRSLLVIHDDGAAGECADDLRHRPLGDTGYRGTSVVEIDVCYDGPDLDEVAAHTRMTVDELAVRHSEAVWTCAFSGFAPGFGYLVTAGDRLHVPRRTTPRPAVPAGSVGLAGEFSGIYPRSSPGGWQLIGRTADRLWDADRSGPALITPRTQVRFRPVDRLPEVASRPAAADPFASGAAAALTVLKPGILTTVQDLGRPGGAALAVSPSGAADRGSLVAANRLVGNADGQAALELTLGGLTIRAERRILVAVTGAAGAVTVSSGGGRRHLGTGRPIALSIGDELAVGTPGHGLRGYLAVAGGVAAPLVLGSRSTDLLSGLGPPPLRRGDRLTIQKLLIGDEPVADSAVVHSAEAPKAPTEPGAFVGDPVRADSALEVTVGPHLEYLDTAAPETLIRTSWTVTPQSNRVGIRLDGHPIERSDRGELPSAPLVAGAVQIPPSGLPIVFLRDHPTTGGYPVVAVLTPAGVDRAAQLRPGSPVRFTLVADR